MTNESAPPPALRVRHLSKSFAGRTVLSDFDLDIQPGEIHALLGQNGSGKSTLIKSLAGYHEPDAGSEVEIGGKPLTFGSPSSSFDLGCRFVHQDLALIGSMSIVDNLFLSSSFPTRFGTVDRRENRRRAVEALEVVGLDVDPSQIVDTLRPSERTGVAVARALLGHDGVLPSVIVLDEPTATLPTPEVAALLSTLRATAAAGIGILYVTHHLEEIRGFAQHVSILRNGKLVGTWEVDEISRGDLVKNLVGEQLAAALEEAVAPPAEATKGEPVLSIDSVGAGRLFELSLDVRPGEVVGIYGLTGSGSENALPAIFGSIKRSEGSVTIAGETLPDGRPDLSIRAGIGYMPPDRKTLGGVMTFSARHNITLLDLHPFWRRGTLRKKPEIVEAQSWFDRLNIEPRSGEDAVLGTFSGGNQQKVLLAKWLRLVPKVLLLDEPSQGVDIGAKLEVHRQITAAAEAGAAVVVCSSEVEELVSLCTRVLIISEGYVSDELVGSRVNVTEINMSFHSGQSTKDRRKVSS